ncbi:MAG: hypothetical protein HXX14_11105 [Bacteroidetes bacterium]|nr:hypothetical protein [Bacteroidota bacterium]
MKHLMFGLAFISTLMLFGCSKVIYSHQQVMGKYQNKDGIVNRFGLPTEIMRDDNTEEWVYNYDALSKEQKNGTLNKTESINSTYNIADSSTKINTKNVAQFSPFKRFIKFTFDKKGNTLKWDSHGVNLTTRTISTGKTIGFVLLLIAGSAVVVVGLAIAAFSGAVH